jgi:hypothetical protein
MDANVSGTICPVAFDRLSDVRKNSEVTAACTATASTSTQTRSPSEAARRTTATAALMLAPSSRQP